jgi:hypothetical protein
MPRTQRRSFEARYSQDGQRPTSVKRDMAALGPVVYAIRVDGLIKIGHTSNLSTRAYHLGGWRHLIGWARGDLNDEQAIHDRLAGHAVRGHEWYPEDDPQVLHIVNDMRAALGIPAL